MAAERARRYGGGTGRGAEPAAKDTETAARPRTLFCALNDPPDPSELAETQQ